MLISQWLLAGAALIAIVLITLCVHWRNQWLLVRQQLKQAEDQTKELQERMATKELELNRLHAALGQSRTNEHALKNQLSELKQSEVRLQHQFENLANRIFDQKQQSFVQQNHQSLDAVLTPIRQQLEQFRHQAHHSHTEESKQRHALEQQLKDLKALNQRMAEEAVNLTKALKGDNKAQGTWGEVVLARLLNACGLREGEEFETQHSAQHASGKRYQPDVVINLPEQRHLIIDAKMSLVAFERFHNADSDAIRAESLAEHLKSIKLQVKGLANKDYQSLEGLHCLDFVLMFIPVEPAFTIAIEAEPELLTDALDQNVMIVSPNTLLVALRTIENLWRHQKQNDNAREIAAAAGKLYDKLIGFTDDLQQVGRTIDKAQEAYQQALGKFSQGRGNLVRQGELLKQLGADTHKQQSDVLVERAKLDLSDPL